MLICFIISCLVLLHVISTGLWDPPNLKRQLHNSASCGLARKSRLGSASAFCKYSFGSDISRMILLTFMFVAAAADMVVISLAVKVKVEAEL